MQHTISLGIITNGPLNVILEKQNETGRRVTSDDSRWSQKQMKTKKMLGGVGVKVKVKGEEQDDNWDVMCVPTALGVEN